MEPSLPEHLRTRTYEVPENTQQMTTGASSSSDPRLAATSDQGAQTDPNITLLDPDVEEDPYSTPEYYDGVLAQMVATLRGEPVPPNPGLPDDPFFGVVAGQERQAIPAIEDPERTEEPERTVAAARRHRFRRTRRHREEQERSRRRPKKKKVRRIIGDTGSASDMTSWARLSH